MNCLRLLLLLLLPISSCQWQSEEESPGEYPVLSGLYYNGPEASVFVPCGMGIPPDYGAPGYALGYWLDRTQDDSAKFNAQIDKQTAVDVGYETVVYISIEARLSEVGRFGHLGQYEREIVPIRLIDIGPMEACFNKVE